MSGFDPMKGLTLFGEDRYVLVDDAGRIVITFDAVGDLLMATTVGNIDELAALNDIPLPNGAPVAMANVRDFWFLERGSTEAPDGITIIATASGIGNWHRACLPHNHWRGQMDWWMDSVNGDDENFGTVVTAPLKTFEEFRRRHGRQLTDHNQAPAAKTFTILDTGDVDQNFILDMFARPYPETFTLIGTIGDAIYSGSVTGFVARNPGAQQEAELTDAAIPVSWTASGLIHKQMILTSGANVGATAYISSDLGANTALMPYFLDAAGTVAVEPAVADTFDVFNQTTIKGGIRLDSTSGIVYLRTIDVAAVVESYSDLEVHRGLLFAHRCAFMGDGYYTLLIHDGAVELHGCMIVGKGWTGEKGLLYAHCLLCSCSTKSYLRGSFLVTMSAGTFDNSSQISLSYGGQWHCLGDDSMFVNYGAERPFTLRPGCILEADAVMWGTTGNSPTYAFSLGNMATIVADAANLQIMGGTVNDIELGSVGVAYGAARPMVDVASEAKVLDEHGP